MSNYRKPIPKTQAELSQDSTTPYTSRGKSEIPGDKNRGYSRSVKNDDVKQFTIGLKDIDETIVYYFNNVIKPSVIQNGKRIPVPILYGSPERWKAVQKDGYYRDKNGKIQTPLLMFKRDSVEKNRSLGNKLDANNPRNFGIFEKRFSQKNKYDKFDILNNRIPVKELYGVIIPDYVNIKYSCVIFTEYVEQMNKIIESINFASDSYWGDPQKFNFRAMIDSYSTNTELNQGEDRTVKTSFEISLLGHIVSDGINTSKANMNKFYSKAAVNFNFETAGNTEILNARAQTDSKDAQNRFFDQSKTTVNTTVQLTDEIKEYLTLNEVLETGLDSYSIDENSNSITFFNVAIANTPEGYNPPEVEDYQVFINGVSIRYSSITSIKQVEEGIKISFNSDLTFTLLEDMDVTVIGKFIK